jgi:D-sedoheptulose 7-phosphate isomerase
MAQGMLAGYFAEIAQAAKALPVDRVERIVRIIVAAQARQSTIFIFGNGGSASTASHFACDLAKNATSPGGRRVRALALTDSVALQTAWANDNGYHTVFAEQLAVHARPGDIVIAISGSGNSPNVLRAVEHARALGLTTIGFCGFDGGRLADLVDHAVVVPASCIQVVEDAHDRDGVINARRPDHVKNSGEFRFLPDVLEALAQLAQLDAPVVLATNQSVIGRRLTSRQAVDEIHRAMQDVISAFGGPRLALYVCPHAPEDGCECRKPRPGLLLQAAAELGLDLPRSVFIGDSLTDVSAALAAGCRPILVGHRGAAVGTGASETVRCVESFAEAVRLVLADPVFAAAEQAAPERELVAA